MGLGGGGCSIAKRFYELANNEENKLYLFDTDQNFALPKAKSMEEAEQKTPNFNLNLMNQDILFIMCGGGNTSGYALRLLEQIKDNTIDILYVRPDVSLMSREEKLKEKVAFNILQEMTRSGLFNKMILVSNQHVANSNEDISLDNYYDKINETIEYVYGHINYFLSLKPVRNNLTAPKEVCRLVTIGMMDYESGQEQMLFPMENIREKQILFGLSPETLKNRKSLQKIQDHLTKIENGGIICSHKILSLEIDDNLVLTLSYTNFIQNQLILNNGEN
jgi:hypothetical protein